MGKCQNCEHGYVVLPKDQYVVSREMAIDCGEPEMEGALVGGIEEQTLCLCCSGRWEDCPNCVELPLPKRWRDEMPYV